MGMKQNIVSALIAVMSLMLFPASATAREWFVAPGGTGNGTASSPFGAVQAAHRRCPAGRYRARANRHV